jgi:hypothetical protein
MRKRWIQIDGELIPADQVTQQSEAKVHIVGDIEPYKAVTGDMQGKWITSRSKHREYLRRNNLIEVGNEKAYFTRHGGMTPDNPNLISERKHEERVCQSLTRTLEKLRR